MENLESSNSDRTPTVSKTSPAYAERMHTENTSGASNWNVRGNQSVFRGGELWTVTKEARRTHQRGRGHFPELSPNDVNLNFLVMVLEGGGRSGSPFRNRNRIRFRFSIRIFMLRPTLRERLVPAIHWRRLEFSWIFIRHHLVYVSMFN